MGVLTVTEWYRLGHFKSESEARGAFELAYQQGLDGMGSSIHAWMGMTGDEYDAWMRCGALPPMRRRPPMPASPTETPPGSPTHPTQPLAPRRRARAEPRPR